MPEPNLPILHQLALEPTVKTYLKHNLCQQNKSKESEETKFMRLTAGAHAMAKEWRLGYQSESQGEKRFRGEAVKLVGE